MQIPNQALVNMLTVLQKSMDEETPLPPDFYDELSGHPEYGLELLNHFAHLKLDDISQPEFFACLHFVELCLVQLRLAREHHERFAEQHLKHYQEALVNLMRVNQDPGQWMPLMNVFFEAGVPLDDEVKYVYLKNLESAYESEEGKLKQEILFKKLLSDDNEASSIELAEMLFAQTNALPVDFFPSFVEELLSINSKKAMNVACLFVLHPEPSIREEVIKSLPNLVASYALPEATMSRLVLIRNWLNEPSKQIIDEVIAAQRKKGTEFKDNVPYELVKAQATELDGSGAEALFFLIKVNTKHYHAAGLLVKRGVGVKDAWLSPLLPYEEALKFATQGMNQELNLRKVDKQYIETIVAHHIATGVSAGNIPVLSVLRLQELVGLQWQGHLLDFKLALEQLGSALGSVDKDFYEKSLARSGKWQKTKRFTHSWFEESAELDRIVNQYCSFVDGVKHCDLDKAVQDLLRDYFEQQREKWLEHFLWMALWAKSVSRKNELLWKDCFVLANLISEGYPLEALPIMQVICEESVILSIETMHYRKTHLS